MAILHEICRHRRTTLIIASQYGVSPTSISESDQHRIEYRKGILSNFHVTITMLSNDSSKFFESILREAWNEYRPLPATSPLQLSLIELEKAADRRKRADAKRLEAAEWAETLKRAEEKKAVKAEKLAADKLEIANNLAERASFKRDEEKERAEAAKEAANKLAAATNCTEHDSSSKYESKWEDMFEVLVRCIKEIREMATRHMNDEQKATWIWNGHVPKGYKTPCGKALGRWIGTQRLVKAKDTLKIERLSRSSTYQYRYQMEDDLMNEQPYYYESCL